MDRLRELLNKFLEILKGLSNVQKIIIGAVLAVALVLIFTLTMRPSEPAYQILYSGLTPEESAEIVEELRSENVPYRPSSDLSTIYVPREKILDLRLTMATKGLGIGRGVGFEIFQERTFGMTEFQQKVNFLRAMQTELERTINRVEEIEMSRVHLSIPEKSLFVEEEEKPTASVMLTFHRGRSLSRNQVKGIVHLVASSVPGLEPKEVTIVDGFGNILSEGIEEGVPGMLTATQMELQRKIESDLEKKVRAILAPVVGRPEKVIANVTALLDFTRREQQKEDYDPGRIAMRSEQIMSEKYEGGSRIPIGVPGVRGNIPPDQLMPGTVGGKTSYQKEKETINYEVTKTTSLLIHPVGQIKRLTMAVLLDGNYEWVKDEEGEEIRKYIAISDDELRGYEDLIKKTVGYSEERGDEISIRNFPLKALTIKEDELRALRKREALEKQMRVYFKYGIYGALVFVLFVIGISSLIFINRWMRAKHEEKLAEIRAIEEVEKEEGPPSITLEEGIFLQRTKEFAKKEPKAAAELIRALMKKGG